MPSVIVGFLNPVEKSVGSYPSALRSVADRTVDGIGAATQDPPTRLRSAIRLVLVLPLRRAGAARDVGDAAERVDVVAERPRCLGVGDGAERSVQVAADEPARRGALERELGDPGVGERVPDEAQVGAAAADRRGDAAAVAVVAVRGGDVPVLGTEPERTSCVRFETLS
jgi:hypothetical protein